MPHETEQIFPIKTVLIIGAGRLAWSLIPALQNAEFKVMGIMSRSTVEAERFGRVYSIDFFHNHEELPAADLVILTVPDAAIESTAQSLLPFLNQNQLLAHTSGSVSIEALCTDSATGVLYPMQAFTKEFVVPFNSPDIPFFVEGSDGVTRNRLLDLANRLSGKVQELDSLARRKLHLGAVISCNFSNLMYRLTAELIPEVEFAVFESLIRNQVELATRLGPASAQTGPAIRGDETTIATHLELLRENPEIQEMYLFLSRLINPTISDPRAL